MSAKRALIVDDSKSARAFLARILERYELAVDTAENAELAIEYLTRSQPDVIFMDHLMPGMDGFQAVQSIKNNPRTATIPIMMYTSQEGELYLGQARALGAVGVMPKQIRPADVSKVLYQLKLLPDRRGGDQTSFTPANATALSATLVGANADTANTTTQSSLALGAEIRTMVDVVVREHIADLRRSVALALDRQSDRLLGDVKAAVSELAAAPVSPALLQPPPPKRTGWIAAALASVVAAALGVLWWHEAQQSDALISQLVSLRQRVAAAAVDAHAQQAETATAASGAVTGTIAPANNGAIVAGMPLSNALNSAVNAAISTYDMQLPVPYGEAPMSGERQETVRATLADMMRRRLRGKVMLTTYPGRFCLIGNPNEGYAPAPEDLQYSKCDLVGNPYEEALEPAQREPIGVANLGAITRRDSGNTLDLQLTTGRADAVVVAYPAGGEKLTAGEWNRAAAANNRLELRLKPAP